VRRDDAINALKAIKATSHAPRGDHDADNLTDTPVAV
jgi:hypothetical protein